MIAVFLSAVTIVPVLLAFALGYAFSLDPTVVRDTARVLAASLAFGAIVVVSAGLLMLAFSSLSRNSRYVGAMWLGFWVISSMASGVLERTVRAEWCPLVSYTRNLNRIRDALLDAEHGLGPGGEPLRRWAGARSAGPSAIGPFGPGRPGPIRRWPPRPSPAAGLRTDRCAGRAPLAVAAAIPLAPATYPWQWSAGVLAGLAVASCHPHDPRPRARPAAVNHG